MQECCSERITSAEGSVLQGDCNNLRKPDLPVLGILDELEAIAVGCGRAICSQTSEKLFLLLRLEETALLRERDDHPKAGNTEDDSDQAFDDEDPTPAFVTRSTVHIRNGVGEKLNSVVSHVLRRRAFGEVTHAIESTSAQHGGEEDGIAAQKLVLLVVAGEDKSRARNEARLADTHEQTTGNQTSPALSNALANNTETCS